VFVAEPSAKMPLLDRLNKGINKELTRLGIEIPFPQQDVHIHGAEGLGGYVGVSNPSSSGAGGSAGGADGTDSTGGADSSGGADSASAAR